MTTSPTRPHITLVHDVYVAGYAPDAGESAVDLNARYPLASGASSIQPSETAAANAQ